MFFDWIKFCSIPRSRNAEHCVKKCTKQLKSVILMVKLLFITHYVFIIFKLKFRYFKILKKLLNIYKFTTFLWSTKLSFQSTYSEKISASAKNCSHRFSISVHCSMNQNEHLWHYLKILISSGMSHYQQ